MELSVLLHPHAKWACAIDFVRSLKILHIEVLFHAIHQAGRQLGWPVCRQPRFFIIMIAAPVAIPVQFRVSQLGKDLRPLGDSARHLEQKPETVNATVYRRDGADYIEVANSLGWAGKMLPEV